MDINESLKNRFKAQLPENYQRRIIFWKDPEREFEGMVDDLALDDVKIIKLTGTNSFAVKMLLSESDTSSDYLVYDPLNYNDIRENWLLDIELYSEIFRADLVSIRMQELNMADTPALRQAVKGYTRFFGSKERFAKLMAYHSDYASPAQLHLDVMAILSGAANNTSQGILQAVLSDDLNAENNIAIGSIRKFGSEAALQELIRQQTGYEGSIGGSLYPLASQILFSALSMTMDPSKLYEFKGLISERHREVCYNFVNEWLHSGRSGQDKLFEIARAIEPHYELAGRFSKLDVEDLWDSECFPCINECIIWKFMNEISENVVRSDLIEAAIEKRRILAGYDRFESFYEGLQQTARMQRFMQQNAAGFHIANTEAFWKEYCGKYYQMDQMYRMFHSAFGKSLKEASTSLDDAYKNTADFVERLYKNSFLSSLAGQWHLLTRDEFQRNPRLSGIPHQEDFYTAYVQRTADAGQRVFVIISDGLRYEVAEELSQQLTRDTRGSVNLSSMQAIFPSVTAYGMAALLPHDRLSLGDNGEIFCDGINAENTDNREKILRKKHPGNKVFTSKAFLSLKQQELREAISDARCVYIYHNVIDAIGDKAITEDRVFEACEEAITEIKKLVRAIVNELSGTNIYITADHGFLYTWQPLKEWDKTGKGDLTGNTVKTGHRFILAAADAPRPDEHMLRIPMEPLNSTLVGYTPADNIRISTGSGGMNYVHGGTALQEIVVPVIEFKNKRPGSKNFVDMKKAELQLISQSRKISNSIFSLNFYQKEPVGGKTSPAEYVIYLTDIRGKDVSNRQKVIADKASENNNDRVFRVRFTLKSMTFSNTDTYYLLITDKETGTVIERVEFTIDITFTNDFDF